MKWCELTRVQQTGHDGVAQETFIFLSNFFRLTYILFVKNDLPMREGVTEILLHCTVATVVDGVKTFSSHFAQNSILGALRGNLFKYVPKV